MTVAEIVGFGLIILGGMAGLIKAMVLKRLDNIEAKIDGHDERLQDVTGRVISLEEWRRNSSMLGRRATDGCPKDDCPFDRTDPGLSLTGSGAKVLKDLIEQAHRAGGDR